MKTINFLSDFWQKAKSAIKEIEDDLPNLEPENILKSNGKMLIVNFEDIDNSWHPKDLIMRNNGKSKDLNLFTDKVRSVFEKSPDKVADFLITTARKGYYINKMNEGERVFFKPKDLNRLKEYIKENM